MHKYNILVNIFHSYLYNLFSLLLDFPMVAICLSCSILCLKGRVKFMPQQMRSTHIYARHFHSFVLWRFVGSTELQQNLLGLFFSIKLESSVSVKLKIMSINGLVLKLKIFWRKLKIKCGVYLCWLGFFSGPWLNPVFRAVLRHF